MATVSGGIGGFGGSANAPSPGTPPTAAPATQSQNGQMAALGISPEEAERRRQQTGVSSGATGYVSGQVNPGGSTAGAPGTVPAGGGGSRTVTQAINDFKNAPPRPPPPAGSWIGNALGVPNPGGDTTTRTGALSAPGAPAPGTTTATNTGTQNGYNPLGPIAGPVSSIPIAGPIINGLTSTSEANLNPTIAAQNAAMGASQNFNQERYDYRPGEAPAQDRVALDAANQDQIRQRQLAALTGLNAAANGTVPSAAEIQMREQAARNNAATLGAARALGGRSAGGAARAATLANAETNARTNVDAAAQRAQEMAVARQAEIQALSGTRGQDVDVAQANANLNQAANANNLTAQTQANQLAEQHRQALIDAQLKALGIGTTAAGDTVGASAKNAEAENKMKGGVLDTVTGALGL